MRDFTDTLYIVWKRPRASMGHPVRKKSSNGVNSDCHLFFVMAATFSKADYNKNLKNVFSVL